ncbi:MAG: methylaspartate mutase accessory protein GlmL [Eubacteriales bacterium]|nr:methylaspartate mutase accessory protein GlmL [Eubacteriales bacterium]
MQAVLLIDFGSTFTKLTLADVSERKIIASAQSFTTAQTDIMQGFQNALEILQNQTGDVSKVKRLACSSAAGGLRMLASGLVPSLTSKAAKLAAFGAGAKVLKTYAYELTDDDIKEIDSINPEIFLLTGGTDGGNYKVIEANAKKIARCEKPFPVVVAGNRSAGKNCAQSIESALHPVFLTENVMPELNRLNIAPAQDIIRQIFLERIISGKGLSREKALIDGILMPTPASVLSALTLLSEGTKEIKGLGELVCIDLGGATTDVYSIAKGYPSLPSVTLHGLQEPYAKRSVEGDIGMRYSARGIVEAAGIEALADLAGVTEKEVEDYLEILGQDKSFLPKNPKEHMLEEALAALAIRTALIRHSGEIQRVFTPSGAVFKQQGKDLSTVNTVILTGGALVHTDKGQKILDMAVSNVDESCLIPRHAKAIIDTKYILSAMGLLATYDRDAACAIMKDNIGGGL